jgi:hypothetical protein
MKMVIKMFYLFCFLLLITGSIFSVGVMMLLNKRKKIGVTLAILALVGLFVVFYIFNHEGLIDPNHIPEF